MPPLASTVPSGRSVRFSYARAKLMAEVSRHVGVACVMSSTAVRPCVAYAERAVEVGVGPRPGFHDLVGEVHDGAHAVERARVQGLPGPLSGRDRPRRHVRADVDQAPVRQLEHQRIQRRGQPRAGEVGPRVRHRVEDLRQRVDGRVAERRQLARSGSARCCRPRTRTPCRSPISVAVGYQRPTVISGCRDHVFVEVLKIVVSARPTSAAECPPTMSARPSGSRTCPEQNRFRP